MLKGTATRDFTAVMELCCTMACCCAKHPGFLPYRQRFAC